MKVLLVANAAWSISNFRNGLLVALLDRGWKVTILAPLDQSVEYLRNLGCEVINLPLAAKGVNPFQDMKLFFQMVHLYKKIQPDFVIHYTIKPNIYGSFACNFLKIPTLAVTTGLGYTFLNENLIAKVARFLYKLAFKSPVEIWFLNEDDRKSFIDFKLLDPRRAILLDSEGIDTDYFHPMKVDKKDENIRFLLIARMLWDKGVAEFVDAARRIKIDHPLAIFQLLGACSVANPSAIDRVQIDTWVQEGIIEYLGTTDDVRSVIAEADCIVLPSYREGVPRTLLEAAAMGKPLITTDTAGCKEVVIHNKTGWLCTSKSAKSLSDCCEIFLQTSLNQRQAMGMNGRAYMIERFDQNKVIKQYLDLLKNYINK